MALPSPRCSIASSALVPFTMLRSAAAIVSGLVLTHASSAAGPERPLFELATEKASRAVLTVGGALPAGVTPPATPALTSPMLLSLHGALAALTGPQITQLADACRAAKPVELTPDFRRTCVVHLFDHTGKDARRIEVLTGPAGTIAARPLAEASAPPGTDPAPRQAAPSGLATLLDAEKFRQLSLNWPRYRGPFEKGAAGLTDPAAAPPVAFDAAPAIEPLQRPVPAPLYLDERTFSDRFLSGGTARPLKPVRILSQEKFHLRPPAKYDPAHPVGLLVWINAGPDGRPPAAFSAALDELGIACIGPDNAGNDRPVVDRFQLALDALFAASERLHVDPRRVYLTGISGGGRTVTRLACCFPDYFTGAAPIVGLSAWFDTPLPPPGSGKHSPAGFDRPNTLRFNILRTRRIGAITGDKDFNHDEMVAIADRMTKDRLQIRIFDHEHYGHQMPSPEQFTEALKWVDEPYQQTVAKEQETAKTLLDAYVEKWGGGGDKPPAPKDTKARAELVKVTQVAPWSEPAWRAAGLLDESYRH